MALKEPWICRIVVTDSHHLDEDPDLNQSVKSYPDPHQGGKSDP
jgi:hypothetical protein